jgi:hypothetical protein
MSIILAKMNHPNKLEEESRLPGKDNTKDTEGKFAKAVYRMSS